MENTRLALTEPITVALYVSAISSLGVLVPGCICQNCRVMQCGWYCESQYAGRRSWKGPSVKHRIKTFDDLIPSPPKPSTPLHTAARLTSPAAALSQSQYLQGSINFFDNAYVRLTVARHHIRKHVVLFRKHQGSIYAKARIERLDELVIGLAGVLVNQRFGSLCLSRTI